MHFLFERKFGERVFLDQNLTQIQSQNHKSESIGLCYTICMQTFGPFGLTKKFHLVILFCQSVNILIRLNLLGPKNLIRFHELVK